MVQKRDDTSRAEAFFENLFMFSFSLTFVIPNIKTGGNTKRKIFASGIKNNDI